MTTAGRSSSVRPEDSIIVRPVGVRHQTRGGSGAAGRRRSAAPAPPPTWRHRRSPPPGRRCCAAAVPGGHQRLEHDVGQFDVVGHELPQALRRHPVDRTALPHPAQQVDILPGQQVQFTNKAAASTTATIAAGTSAVSVRTTSTEPRSTTIRSTSSSPGVNSTSPDESPARAVGQKPGEQLIAQPWRGGAGRHQRLVQPSACVAGAQPIQIMRRGPGRRPGQAGLAEHRAARSPGRGVGTRQFIHRCHAFSSPAIWSNLLSPT